MNESASASQLSFWSEPLAEELLRFLTGRLKCREAAADLTHENYLRLHRFCQTGTPDNAKAIAFHIAVNLAIDYQRKAAVRNRFTIDADLNTLHDADMADHTASPERILMSRQRFDTLQAALDELPLNCRTAFLLYSVDGLSYTEIAERLNISKSMVGKHLAKAMDHCSERLDED